MAAGQSKKSKKHDRNRPWCVAYRSRGQRERNKAVKLLRHLKRHPGDATAHAVLSALPPLFVKAAQKSRAEAA